MQFVKSSFLVLFSASVLFACKKEDSGSVTPPPTPTPTGPTLADKQKDTALMYSKDIYLWNSQIPSTFNARSYDDLNKLMVGIRQYSTESGFSMPVDRWSFAIEQKEWDNVSSGIAGDFGIKVFFIKEGDLRVKSVEAASPAGKAGVRRGWRIAKINGSDNITTANSSFIVEKIYNSNSSTITFEKPDKSTVDVNLSVAQYKADPIYLDTVYTINSKKVGYLVFNSFLGDTTQIYNNFQNVFGRFAQQNVTDVVVDLRYNGGGYVSVQNKLANYLVNSSANGNIMMKQEYNTNYSQYNRTTYFQKLGNLNLNRIFFIVSSSSASASELIINNLKPYMDVKLVGPSKTYGKPVGYFAIPVGNWYIFPVSSRTINKNGEANYYNGFPLDSQVGDGLDKDWGDVTETSLASTLKYISTGAFRMRAPETFSQEPAVVNSNLLLDKDAFKGAVNPSIAY